MRTLILDEISLVSGGDFSNKLQIAGGLVGALIGGVYGGTTGFIGGAFLNFLGFPTAASVGLGIAGVVCGGLAGGLISYGVVAGGCYAVNYLAGETNSK